MLKFLAFIFISMWPTLSLSEEDCDLSGQAKARVASIGQVEIHEFGDKPFAHIFFQFRNVTIYASTFRCTKRADREFPGYGSHGIITELRDIKSIDIHTPSDYARLILSNSNKDYEVEDIYFYDNIEGTETIITSTMEFFLDNYRKFGIEGGIKGVVSASFFSSNEQLETPSGLLFSSGEIISEPRYFSARTILCIKNDGLDVRQISKFAPEGGDLRKMFSSIIKPRIINYVRKNCDAALQIGPAYLEPDDNGYKYGISGFSHTKAKRIALTKILIGSEPRYVIIQVAAEMNPFDFMALIVRVMEEKYKGNAEIKWSVGLQSGIYLSGVELFVDDIRYSLGETTVPSGSFLIFR